MVITTLSSRQFNQDASGAKKAAKRGPVIITDRGRPAHVLLSIEEYRRLAGSQQSLLDALAQTQGNDFDFKAPRLRGGLFRAADFS
jgi:prevent-host-death family protein